MSLETGFRRWREWLVSPSEPSKKRLHPVAALISVLRTLRGLLPLFLVILITQRGEIATMLLVALIAGGVSLIEGIGSWLRYIYWISEGELRVERGFVVRQRIMIPAERVQTVDVSAGLLQRLFGLVKVEVKTAAGTQVVMSAITRQNADELRQALAAGGSAESATETAPASYSYALSIPELLLAASTSGRLGVLLSGIVWVYSYVDDFVDEQLIEALGSVDLTGSLTRASPGFIAALVVLGFLLAFVASVIAEVARFGGFSVTRSGDQLVIRRGLFERREISVSLERIQAIRIVEGLLRQPLGYASLIVETAGHAEERGQSTQLHPFLHRSQWLSLLGALTPEHAVAPELERPPRRALRRFATRPTLLALAVALPLTLALPFGWLSLALVLLAPWLGYLSYRDAAAGTQAQTLLLRRRSVRRVTALVRRQRIQYTETSSSFLQRRRRLGDFAVAVASGTGGRRLWVSDLDSQAVDRLMEWSVGRQPIL